jgi:DNA-binding NtrC family response regulator
MTDRPLKVLLVEDHEDTRKYLGLYLEQSGHSVRSVRTIQHAVETLAASACDVLLSDIGLADGSGWDLLKQLDRLPPYCIAMSGFGTAADANRSTAAGYRRHLVKPIDPDLLDEVLEDARRARDALESTQGLAGT